MKHMMTDQIVEVLTNPKIGWSVVSAGVGSQAASSYGWLTENMTVIATGVSIILSLVVITSHIVKFIQNYKSEKVNKEIRVKIEEIRAREARMSIEKHDLEMDLLRERLRRLSEKGIDTVDPEE